MTNHDWDCEKDEDKHYDEEDYYDDDDGTQWTLICELSPALFPPYPDDASYQWNGWQWGSPQLYNGVQHTIHNAVSNDEEATTPQGVPEKCFFLNFSAHLADIRYLPLYWIAHHKIICK